MGSKGLKIPVSVVRFRPWAPTSRLNQAAFPEARITSALRLCFGCASPYLQAARVRRPSASCGGATARRPVWRERDAERDARTRRREARDRVASGPRARAESEAARVGALARAELQQPARARRGHRRCAKVRDARAAHRGSRPDDRVPAGQTGENREVRTSLRPRLDAAWHESRPMPKNPDDRAAARVAPGAREELRVPSDAGALTKAIGRPIATTLRTLSQMKAIVDGNPFASVATNSAYLCVMLCLIRVVHAKRQITLELHTGSTPERRRSDKFVLSEPHMRRRHRTSTGHITGDNYAEAEVRGAASSGCRHVYCQPPILPRQRRDRWNRRRGGCGRCHGAELGCRSAWDS